VTGNLFLLGSDQKQCYSLAGIFLSRQLKYSTVARILQENQKRGIYSEVIKNSTWGGNVDLSVLSSSS